MTTRNINRMRRKMRNCVIRCQTYDEGNNNNNNNEDTTILLRYYTAIAVSCILLELPLAERVPDTWLLRLTTNNGDLFRSVSARGKVLRTLESTSRTSLQLQTRRLNPKRYWVEGLIFHPPGIKPKIRSTIVACKIGYLKYSPT